MCTRTGTVGLWGVEELRHSNHCSTSLAGLRHPVRWGSADVEERVTVGL